MKDRKSASTAHVIPHNIANKNYKMTFFFGVLRNTEYQSCANAHRSHLSRQLNLYRHEGDLGLKSGAEKKRHLSISLSVWGGECKVLLEQDLDRKVGRLMLNGNQCYLLNCNRLRG